MLKIFEVKYENNPFKTADVIEQTKQDVPYFIRFVQIMVCRISVLSHYLNQCWTMLIGFFGTYFRERVIEIQNFLFRKMPLNVLAILSEPQCENMGFLGNVIAQSSFIKA